jgi:rod shape-determining protein MreD
MRWIAFLVFAYFVLAAQLGLGGYINWGRATPNLVLAAVVFVTINARREDALLSAFLLGLSQDLFTQQPMGLYAFTYSLVALFIVGASPVVQKDNPLAHFALTLLAGLATGVVLLFNEWAYARVHPSAGPSDVSVWAAISSAFYSAMLAPVVLFPASRLKRFFGFRNQRSGTGMRSAARA